MINTKIKLLRPHKIFLLFTLVVFNLWLVVGCQWQWTNQEDNKEFQLMENEQLYAAQDTGQIIVEGDKLRIGVGNIWKEAYTNEDGEQVHGMTAGLWLFFRDSPNSDHYVRVYQGQIFKTEGYLIRMVEINEDDSMVVVGVAPPSKEKAP